MVMCRLVFDLIKSPSRLIRLFTLLSFLAAGLAHGQPPPSDVPVPLPSTTTPPTNTPASTGTTTGDLFQPGQVVAIVGDQYILAGDILGRINQILKQYEGKATKEQLEAQMPKLFQQMLKDAIDTKLAYHDFLRSVPPENLEELHAKVDTQYDSTQLKKKMEAAGVGSAAEFDAALRSQGSSLTKARRAFTERALASEMMRRNVNVDAEITHEDMLEYYHGQIEEYQVPGKVRWEELVTELSHYKVKSAAFRELAENGNQILRGAKLDAVARKMQQGPRWKEGGAHDWTTEGSLVSDKLDEALFSLPVGELSEIIEDDEGFHIIRVVERTPAHLVPFTEAQVKIKKSLQNQRRQKQVQEYVTNLRKTTPTWTIFDDQQGSRKLTERLSGSRPLPR